MNNTSVLVTKSTKIFRDRLKSLMDAHNEDNRTLHDKTGISENTISSWFIGKYREKNREHYYPSLKHENIEKICKHYNVTPEYLFGVDKYKTHTNQELGDMIGLGEAAIDTLRKWADSENPFIQGLYVFDTILSSENNAGLMLAIYQYLVSDNSFPIVTEKIENDGETYYAQEAYDRNKSRLEFILPCEILGRYKMQSSTNNFNLDGSLLRSDAINHISSSLEKIRKEKISPDPIPPKRRGRPPKQKGDDRL